MDTGQDELGSLGVIYGGADTRSTLASNLPEPVLDLLFHLVSADTFASLVVINRHYRRASDSKLLYAYQLASFFGSGDIFSTNYARLQTQPLQTLKRSFAQLARREFFPVYRPRLSTFGFRGPQLDQASNGSSAGPHLRSHLSNDATLLVVTEPFRLHVIDLAGPEPIVRHTITVEVRPDVVEIASSGATFATVVSNSLITVYALRDGQYSILTNLEASQRVTTVALTPDGMTLAAAGQTGMALFSLDEKQSSAPRHIPEGDHVDHLTFAAKGTVLCGLRTLSNGSSQFFSRSLYFPAALGFPSPEELLAAWMEQPLNRLDIDTLQHIFTTNSLTHLKAYLKMLVFYNIEPPQTTRSISGANADAPEFDESNLLLLTLNASLGLSGTSIGDSNIRLARTTNLKSPNDAADGATEVPFKDAFWDGFKNVCRRIEVSVPISDLQWATSSSLDETYRQRLITTSFQIPDSAVEGSTRTQDLASLTFLDFGYHVENREQRKVVINLGDTGIESSERTGARDVNLATSHESTSSSISSLTRDSRDGHSSITSDYREFISDTRQGGSFLPRNTTQQAANLKASPARRSASPSSIKDPSNDSNSNDIRDPQHEQPTNQSSSQPDFEAKTPVHDLPHHLSGAPQPARATSRTLPLAIASTPDLLMQTHDAPEVMPRPRTQHRVRSAFGAARSSVVLSGQNLRRVFSGPLEAPQYDKPQVKEDIPVPAPMVGRTLRTRPQSMALDGLTSSSQPDPRRRSLLPRPNSFHAGTVLSSSSVPSSSDNPHINARRGVSQPLARPQTPPSQIEPFVPSGSPTLPSPSQVLSLHRRQASGSISSAHIRTRSLSGSNDPFAIASHAGGSDGMTAPRAALGAYRRNTGTAPVSPWASTTMLTRGESGPSANRRYSMPLQSMDVNGMGTGLGSQNISLSNSGRTVSAPLLNNLRTISNPTVNGNGISNSRTRGTSITRSGQLPPPRLQENSLPSTPSLTSTPPFGSEVEVRDSNEHKPLPSLPPPEPRDDARPTKIRKGGRLSTIQSVASLMGAARSSSGGEKPATREARPQTMPATTRSGAPNNGDKRRSILLGSAPGVTASVPSGSAGNKKTSLWGKWRQKVMRNLSGV